MPALPAPGGTQGKAGKPYTIPTKGPVTAKEIYYLLLQRGLSSDEAAGVMGNMKAESGLDPESGGIDSNGKWAGGLISWNTGSYPDAHSLVTGDPQKDVRAQINYLFTNTNNLKQGLSGSSAEDIAGNFAAKVEVCQGCQANSTYPNGWTTRRAYASQIAAAIKSGNWESVQTGSYAAAGTPAAGSGSSTGPNCMLQFPGIAGIGSFCVLSKSEARAIIGAAVLVAGGVITLLGAVIMVAWGFQRSGALGKVADAAAVVPGGQGVAAGLQTASKLSSRTGASAAQGKQQKQRAAKTAADRTAKEESAQERHTARQYQRQPRARANRQRDDERQREPVPF